MDTYKKPCERNTKGHTKMSVYEQFSDDNNMEHRTSSTSKVSNMKHGWHQIVNDSVHYFQTPRNVAVTLE